MTTSGFVLCFVTAVVSFVAGWLWYRSRVLERLTAEVVSFHRIADSFRESDPERGAVYDSLGGIVEGVHAWVDVGMPVGLADGVELTDD